MKKLYITRHAKSNWSDPGQDDFDRVLNKRGKNDLPKMGKYLREAGVCPDLMLSSPAARAAKTAKKLAVEIGYPAVNIVFNQSLYLAPKTTLLSVIQQIPAETKTLMIVGHNPGLTELANLLSDADIENIPTCGIATIHFNIDDWASVHRNNAQFIDFTYPKKLL